MNKCYLTLLVWTFYNALAFSQPITSQPYEVMLTTAEEQMEKHEYYNALDWYEKCYEEKKDPAIAIKIAETNQYLRDYKKAENWYKRILRKDKKNRFIAQRFDYGNVLKSSGKYDKALEQYKQFIALSDNPILIKKAEKEVLGIQLAASLDEDISVTVVNAGSKVNSKSEEYSPILDREGNLYFASVNAKDVIVIDGKEDDFFVKIYVSAPDGKGGWAKPRALGDHINRPGAHTANVHISPDGTRMLFTRTLLDGENITESKAYISYASSSGWGPAQEIVGVNGDYNVRHLSIGELYGNEVVFFSANMEGGKGGYDIYYSTRKGEEYSLPTNLGSIINSAEDELTPFYSDGTLYFSSNGHPGLGGFDIFYSVWDGVKWTVPENMGLSYNSSYDDLYYSTNKKGNKGLLVSNRIGTRTKSIKGKSCCDDIWMVNKRDIVIDLLAKIYDEAGNELDNVTIQLFNASDKSTTPLEKNSGEKNVINFLLDADIAYKVLVKKGGYYPLEYEFNTVGKIDSYTYKRKFTLKQKPPEIKIITINEPIRLNNIYYDFDDDKILKESESDLEVLVGLMKQYKDLVIELSSHTDAQGSDEYNKDLSLRRAKSAKRWMIKKGISSKRIKAVGYGEEKILNECTNGVECSDQEHRFNRRTEFKILSGPTTIEIKKEVLEKR